MRKGNYSHIKINDKIYTKNFSLFQSDLSGKFTTKCETYSKLSHQKHVQIQNDLKILLNKYSHEKKRKLLWN